MRLATLLLGLVTAISLCARAPEAQALSCDTPRPFLSPAGGATLPTSPTLYLFDPLGLPRPAIEIDDEVVPYEITEVGQNAGYRIYRLTVETQASGAFLDVTLRPGGLHRYRLDASATTPEPRGTAWPVVAERRRPAWVARGSSQLAVRSPVPAPAYRVAIAADRGADSERIEVVVPGLGDGGSWIYFDEQGVCDDLFAAADRGAWVAVAALGADGNESEITEPVLLDTTGWGDRFVALLILLGAGLLVGGFVARPS